MSALALRARCCLLVLLGGCSLGLDFDKFSVGDAGTCVAAPETCNAVDDDCDGETDEDPTECSVVNGTVACVESTCAFAGCNLGFANCDDDATACETNTSTSHAHCGGCTTPCGAEQACAATGCTDIAEGWAAFLVQTQAGYEGIRQIEATTNGVVGVANLDSSYTSFAGTPLAFGAVAAGTYPSHLFGLTAGGAYAWSYEVTNGGVDRVAASEDGTALYVVGRSAADAVVYRSGVLRNWEATGDGYVLAVDADGSYRWGHHYGPDVWMRGVAVGPSGDVWVVGSYAGELRVDATAYPERTRADGLFVTRQRPNSAVQWVRDFDDTVTVDGVAVDASENAYLYGHGATTFELRQLDLQGNDGWSKVMSCPDGLTGMASFAVSGGVVLVTGSCGGDVAIGDSIVTPPFLAGFDAATGSLLFARSAVGNVRAIVAVDGGFARVGSASVALDFGFGSLGLVGGSDSFIEVLDLEGRHLYGYQFGSDDYEDAFDVDQAPNGAIYVSGHHSGNMTFGGSTNANTGGTDGYVVEIRP